MLAPTPRTHLRSSAGSQSSSRLVQAMTKTRQPGRLAAAVIWSSSSVSTRRAARSSPLDLQQREQFGPQQAQEGAWRCKKPSDVGSITRICCLIAAESITTDLVGAKLSISSIKMIAGDSCAAASNTALWRDAGRVLLHALLLWRPSASALWPFHPPGRAVMSLESQPVNYPSITSSSRHPPQRLLRLAAPLAEDGAGADAQQRDAALRRHLLHQQRLAWGRVRLQRSVEGAGRQGVPTPCAPTGAQCPQRTCIAGTAGQGMGPHVMPQAPAAAPVPGTP